LRNISQIIIIQIKCIQTHHQRNWQSHCEALRLYRKGTWLHHQLWHQVQNWSRGEL